MSITRQLLSIPEIYRSGFGIEHSVVFAALTEQQQQIIAKTANEEEKFALACEFGDQSEAVHHMYRVEIEEPAIRSKNGIPFPKCSKIEESFYFRCLDEETRKMVKNTPDELEKRLIIVRYIDAP